MNVPPLPMQTQMSISTQPRPPLQKAPPSEFTQPKPVPQKQLKKSADLSAPRPTLRRNSFDADDLGLGNRPLKRTPSPTLSVSSDRGSYTAEEHRVSSSPSSIISRVSRFFAFGKSTPNLVDGTADLDHAQSAQRQEERRKSVKANLGERNTFYFDEKLGRWVDETGEGAGAAAALPPPPLSSTPSAGALPQGSSSLYRMPDNLQSRYVDSMKAESPHEQASPPLPRPAIPMPSMRPPLPAAPVIASPSGTGSKTEPAASPKEHYSFSPWVPEPSPVVVSPPVKLPDSSAPGLSSMSPPIRPPAPMSVSSGRGDKKDAHSLHDSMA